MQMQKVVLGVILLFAVFTLYSLIDIITISRTEKEPVVTEAPPPAATKKETISLKEKKRRFIQMILPTVQRVKEQLDAEYAVVKAVAANAERSEAEEAWLQRMMERYNVTGIPCLLRRMHTHPVSLVVAQAALETGWGSSRFFKEANNIFGIWSYNRNEPRMAASELRGEKTIYVKKFASYDTAVRGYFKMIGSSYAYKQFREARIQTDNPFELLRYLRRYSELRDEYVARLYYVIKSNKLYTYDKPAYQPIALADIIPEYVAQKQEEVEQKKALEQQMLALNEVKVDQEEAESLPCDGEEEQVKFTLPAPVPSTEAPARSSLP